MTLDKERYAGDLAPIVMDNSAYAQFILKVDFLQTRVKEWIAEVPEGQVNTRVILERIFILLGKQASRNLIASIRLARIGNTLPRKKSERFSPNPKEQLKQAIVCEEFCEARNYAGSDLAFLGGLQYDLLLTNLTRLKASREVQNAFPTAFSDGLKIAHFAYEIGARMGSFPHSEYAFSAGLSLGLGRALAYALYPKEGKVSYAGFLAEVEKKNVMKWEFAALEERARFPLRPVELSALAAMNYGFLKRVEPAIRFSGEAYYLKRVQPKLYPLALLLGLAENGAAGIPPTPAMLEGLKGMRLPPTIVNEAAKAVSGKAKK
ncbi:MAG: hypothetical protein JST04_11635 [Bdellovibrionales bacterium]|nr:hypothetical protein [Bdellovibrionales bacterium]